MIQREFLDMKFLHLFSTAAAQPLHSSRLTLEHSNGLLAAIFPNTTSIIFLRHNLCTVIPYSRKEWIKYIFIYICSTYIGCSSIAGMVFRYYGYKKPSPVAENWKPLQDRGKITNYYHVL